MLPASQRQFSLSSLSLRDPAGEIFDLGDMMIRGIRPLGLESLRLAKESKTIQQLIYERRFIPSLPLTQSEQVSLMEVCAAQSREVPFCTWVKHPKIFFPSFPCEWTAEMLYEAAELTLDLAQGLLTEGAGIKDATPRNILFEKTNPIFVDLLSVEQRDPKDALWLPFAQFVETFLYPLAAYKYVGVDVRMLMLSHGAGIKAEELYRWLSPMRRWLPPLLTLVTVPALLSGKSKKPTRRSKPNYSPEKAQFILGHLLAHLRRQLGVVKPRPAVSNWTRYHSSECPYTESEFTKKKSLIELILCQNPHGTVLDIGANEGQMSAIAANAGTKVVAIDKDPAVVESIRRNAKVKSADILPLVVDFADPTPSMGWGNEETTSFLSRAENHFDQVWMLATIHHLLLSDGIPLEKILDAVANLSRHIVVMEYISPFDPGFQSLVRGRPHLLEGLDKDSFEARCKRRFEIAGCHPIIEGKRSLYVLRKKGPRVA